MVQVLNLRAPEGWSALWWTGAEDGGMFVEGELPADAIAALLAADSLPLPEELDPCHTVEPPTALRWET